MSVRRLLVIARKEFRHIARDVRRLFLVTVAPAFLLVSLPYVFALILCIPALALTLALTHEKEAGSLEGLMATPVHGTEYLLGKLLLGKLLAYESGGLVSALLARLVATSWFRIPKVWHQYGLGKERRPFLGVLPLTKLSWV